MALEKKAQPDRGLYDWLQAVVGSVLAVIFIPIFQEVTLIVNAKITIPAGSRTSLL